MHTAIYGCSSCFLLYKNIENNQSKRYIEMRIEGIKQIVSAIIYISWKDINNNLKKENLQRLIVVGFKNVLDTSL